MKIVIAGNYGAGNLGDEMILEGILHMLQDIAPNAQITVLSANPIETAKLYRVDSVPPFASGVRSILKRVFNRSRTAEVVKAADYFILGGGGLFGSLKVRANVIWGAQAYWAERYNVPVIAFGQSIGPLKSSLARRITTRVFDHASFIAVRDRFSKAELKRLGILKPIHVVPDAAFKIPTSSKKEFRAKNMVVALRYMRKLPDHFVPEVAKFLDSMSEEGWHIQFVQFKKGPERDLGLHQKVIAAMNHGKKTEILENNDTGSLISAFYKARFVLGMRLHSVITAVKTTTPFIAINYAPKVYSFLESAKILDSIIDMPNVEFNHLTKLFNEVTYNMDKMKTKMRAYQKDAAHKQQVIEQRLKTIII